MLFYNLFLQLCREKHVSPSRAALDVGLSKTAPNGWKKGGLPSDINLLLLSNYFEVPIKDFWRCEDIAEKRGVQIDEDEKITATISDGTEIKKSTSEREELKRLIDRLTDEEVSAILERVKALILGI